MNDQVTIMQPAEWIDSARGSLEWGLNGNAQTEAHWWQTTYLVRSPKSNGVWEECAVGSLFRCNNPFAYMEYIC